MSLTPIFDAVLADSEPDLFLAGAIFPRPVFSKGYKFPTPYDDRIDAMLYSWAAFDPRYKAKVLGDFRIPAADKGHRVIRENSILWADSAA